MAEWSIKLFGQPRITRNGEAVKLRTSQQLLLLARIAAHASHSIDRKETATLLWPDAPVVNQSNYLRRALMELRQKGLPIESVGAKLSLDFDAVTCDLRDRLAEPAIEDHSDELLKDIDHPIADEVRGIWRGHVQSTLDYVESDARLSPANKLRVWLAERLIEENPESVLSVLANHGSDMMFAKPTEGLLDLYLDVLERVPEANPERVAVMLYAGRIAGNLTRYTLARKLHLGVIELAESLNLPREVAQAYAGLAHHSAELHDFESAIHYGEKGVATSKAINDPKSASGALINLGHIYGQQLRYDEAVSLFTEAYELADSIDYEGQKCVALGSLAFYWGVLGCEVNPKILEQATHQAGMGYMAMVDAYTHFSLAVGRKDAKAAAVEAETLLRLTIAEGMERMFYMALDNSAIALAMMDRQESAAVVVRAGTQFRQSFQGGRTPVEKQVIRRHVSPPFFGAEISAALEQMRVREPSLLAQDVALLFQ